MAEECNPCDIGVSLGIAKKICEMVANANTKTKCDELYSSVVMGEITLDSFFKKVEDIVGSDVEATNTIKEVKKFLAEKKVIS